MGLGAKWEHYENSGGDGLKRKRRKPSCTALDGVVGKTTFRQSPEQRTTYTASQGVEGSQSTLASVTPGSTEPGTRWNHKLTL